MKMSRRVAAALSAVGARLKRQKKHLVYELPNGLNIVVAKTPGDARAIDNALRDIRSASGVDERDAVRKADPAVRAARRRRPGRAGAGVARWGNGTPMSEALSKAGLIEQQQRVEIARLIASVEALNETVRAKDAAIAALEALVVVRVWRTVTRRSRS